MSIEKNLFVATAAVLLAGCQTYSFAPPPVALSAKATGSSAWLCKPLKGAPTVSIDPNINGASMLIDNFLLSYRCAAHVAADGRQQFEIPAFFATLTGVIGPAFGLIANDSAVASAAASSTLLAGNKYFAPKEKAAILDSALDAVLCIKTESVGVSFFDTRDPVDEKDPAGNLRTKTDLLAVAKANPTKRIMLPIEKQYYELISASLFSVERILAQRLSKVGIMEAAGVIAQIEQLTKKQEELDAALKTKKGDFGDAPPTSEATQKALLAPDPAAGSTEKKIQNYVAVEMAALQPALQTCVVRAKL